MGFARSTCYDRPEKAADDTAIVEAIFAICDEFECYGYRRVGAALRQQGLVVNAKKIRRLMREHGLQPKARRRFVATTGSDHDSPIFPNLAKDVAPTGPNQLWVSDIIPAFALVDAHIFEVPVGMGAPQEVFEAVLDGDRAWLGARVSVPATKPGDDPGGPGKAARRVGIALQYCPALILAAEGVEETDFVVIEGDAGRRGAVAVPRLDQLQGDDGGLGRDRGEFEQPVRAFDPAILDLQPLGLEDPEELLDRPASLVPINDFPGGSGAVDLVGGQQMPMQGFDAGRRIELGDLDHAQRHRLGQVPHARAPRPLQRHPSKTQRQLGLARRPVGAGDELDRCDIGDRQAGSCFIQAPLIRQDPIVHGARQQVDVWRGDARPLGIDIAFTIVDHSDHGGRGKDLFAPLGRADPAPRFLLLGRPFPVRRRNSALARPDLAGNQPQTGLAVRIQRQHRMQQQAAADALADLPQTALPFGRRPEIELAGVPRFREGRLWIASTCRPATASAVCSPQPASKASNVTFSLARKRPYRTACDR